MTAVEELSAVVGMRRACQDLLFPGLVFTVIAAAIFFLHLCGRDGLQRVG